MSLAQRMKAALDVSGAFDNCLLHAYAAHLLANNLPFPDNLFTFKSIAGADSPASRIQSRFPNVDSLELFAEYSRYQSGRASDSPNFPVEKTLILGFLLREWFATKMSQRQIIPTAELVAEFKTYKEFRNAMTEIEQLQSTENGVLYTANEEFLEYYTARPKSGTLTTKEQRFEQFFTDAHGDSNIALANYCEREGYKNYCLQMSLPGTKLTYGNIMPVMNMLNQAITLYNAEGRQSIIYQHEGSEAIPRLEMKLHGKNGHYHLLKTETTTPLLNEYARSHTQYIREREEILSAPNKDLAVGTKKSLLVGAICPSGHLNNEPFSLLLNKVDQMKRVVDSHKQAEQRAQQDRIERLEQQRIRQIEQRLQEQARVRENRLREEERAPVQQHVEIPSGRALNPIYVQQHVDYKKKIKLLTLKMADFEVNSKRYTIIKNLRDTLSRAGKTYFEGIQNRDTYLEFRQSCSDAILEARPVLEKHADSLKIALSILAIVLTFGIAVGIDLYKNNGKFTLFSTDIIIKVDEVEDHINDVSPPAA